jgi:hypothetical protein
VSIVSDFAGSIFIFLQQFLITFLAFLAMSSFGIVPYDPFPSLFQPVTYFVQAFVSWATTCPVPVLVPCTHHTKGEYCSLSSFIFCATLCALEKALAKLFWSLPTQHSY